LTPAAGWPHTERAERRLTPPAASVRRTVNVCTWRQRGAGYSLRCVLASACLRTVGAFYFCRHRCRWFKGVLQTQRAGPMRAREAEPIGSAPPDRSIVPTTAARAKRKARANGRGRRLSRRAPRGRPRSGDERGIPMQCAAVARGATPPVLRGAERNAGVIGQRDRVDRTRSLNRRAGSEEGKEKGRGRAARKRGFPRGLAIFAVHLSECSAERAASVPGL